MNIHRFMKLNTRLGLITVGLFFLAMASVIFIVNREMRQHELEKAEHEARIILDTVLATNLYFAQDMRPALFRLLEDKGVADSYFDPVWMSVGRANRIIFDYLKQVYSPEVYYKNAAIDARAAENEATPYEAAFLEAIRRTGSEKEWAGVMEVDGRPFFALMVPNQQRYTPFCMKCHGDPAAAPVDLVRIYGDNRSFHKTVGEIPSVFSLRIPLAAAFSDVTGITLKMSAGLLSAVALLFVIHGIYINRTVVKPVKHLRDKANAIAENDAEAGKTVRLEGAPEIEDLCAAFNAMSLRLHRNMDELENRVRRRTLALEDANAKLRQQETKFRLLFENAPMGIGLVRHNGRIVEHNGALSEILGCSRADMALANAADFYAVPDEGRHMLDRLARDGVVRDLDIVLKRGNGESFDARMHVTTLDVDEETAYLTIIEDITEQNQLTSQIQKHQKMEAVGILAGGIAHEFNNLLYIISGNAELLMEDALPASRELLQEIFTSTRRGSDLVKQLLAYSRKSESNMTVVYLNIELIRIRKLLGRIFPRMIEIVLDLEDALLPVKADLGQMEQVLMNLAINARDAMAEGGILTLKAENSARNGKDAVKITVSDTGHGMAPEILNRIFDPFFTTKQVGEGSGLGLSVVYGIIKSHNGQIACQSEPGVGTSFTIHIPAAGSLEASYKAHIPLHEEALLGRECILVVDDEPSILHMTQKMLESLGYETLAAENGEIALECYKAHKQRIDLILLDLNMPGMGGIKCLETLLKTDPAARVVVSSGYAGSGLVHDTLKLGALDYLIKPYSKNDLSKIIRRNLDPDGPESREFAGHHDTLLAGGM